jgi:hypothetical protein
VFVNLQGATILPTHHCFDDALELLIDFVLADPARASSVRLVHGIGRYPAQYLDDGHLKPGDYFAHAWLEEGPIVWESGLVDGAQVAYAVDRSEHHAYLQIVCGTYYSLLAAWHENQRTGTYGPWRPEYLALCRRREARATTLAPAGLGAPTA